VFAAGRSRSRRWRARARASRLPLRAVGCAAVTPAREKSYSAEARKTRGCAGARPAPPPARASAASPPPAPWGSPAPAREGGREASEAAVAREMDGGRWFIDSNASFGFRWRAAERRHPRGCERVGSPTLQKLQEPIVLPWVCFRGGGFPKPRWGFQQRHPEAARGWARPPCRHFKNQSCCCLGLLSRWGGGDTLLDSCRCQSCLSPTSPSSRCSTAPPGGAAASRSAWWNVSSVSAVAAVAVKRNCDLCTLPAAGASVRCHQVP
jgi:hypothetical protein